MTSPRLVVVLAVVAIVGLGIGPAVSASPASFETSESNATEPASNASVSAFMQTSAAETEQTVESGMFDAAFESASNDSQADVVIDRTDALEDRLETLETERDELRDAEADSTPAYEVRLTKLTTEIASLERAIEETKPRAGAAGVDDDRLEDLRSNASDLAGSDVASMAQQLGGANDSIGPPSEAGPAANETPPGQAGAPVEGVGTATGPTDENGDGENEHGLDAEATDTPADDDVTGASATPGDETGPNTDHEASNASSSDAAGGPTDTSETAREDDTGVSGSNAGADSNAGAEPNVGQP